MNGEELKESCNWEGGPFADIPLQSSGTFCCDSATSSTLCSSKQTDSPTDVQEFVVNSEQNEEFLFVVDDCDYLVSSSGDFWDEVWKMGDKKADDLSCTECEEDALSIFTEVDDWMAWGGAAEPAGNLDSDECRSV